MNELTYRGTEKEEERRKKTNLWLLNLRGLCHVSHRTGGCVSTLATSSLFLSV